MSFNDDQPRDELGRWTSGGGGAVGGDAASVWQATAGAGATVSQFSEEARGTSYSDVARTYTMGGDVLNGMVREDRVGEMTEQDRAAITGMDAAIAAQAPTAQDTVLYRGIAPAGMVPIDPAYAGSTAGGGTAPPDFASMQPGDQFTDKGFISTTTSPEVAEGFATQSGTMLEIHAPAGTQGLSIPATRGYDVLGEAETVLPRGTVFQALEPVDPMTGILKVTIAEQ